MQQETYIIHFHRNRPTFSKDSNISFLSAYNILFIKIRSEHNRVINLERKQLKFPAVNKWDQSGEKRSIVPRKDDSCGGQGCLCKNDGRSFLSRFTAQSHADASTRWFSRSRCIRSAATAAFVSGAKFSPRAIERHAREERDREIRTKKTGY